MAECEVSRAVPIGDGASPFKCTLISLVLSRSVMLERSDLFGSLCAGGRLRLGH
jgi:hypothetical protein